MVWQFVCFAVTKVISFAKIQLWRTPRRVTEGYERLRHDICGYLWFRRVSCCPTDASNFTADLQDLLYLFSTDYIYTHVNIALVDNGDEMQNRAAYLPLMR